MVKKVGQRKFLLKCGYTNEELDKMPPYIAHEIIGDIEKANRAKREKEKQKQEAVFGIQECAKCQYKLRCEECIYNEKDISELIRFEKQLAGKEMAEKILKEIRGYYPVDKSNCEKYEKFIIELCEDIAKQCGVEIKE